VEPSGAQPVDLCRVGRARGLSSTGCVVLLLSVGVSGKLLLEFRVGSIESCFLGLESGSLKAASWVWSRIH
jgi:hypothetical protein